MPGPAAGQQPKFFRIAGASAGGTYFEMAAVIASAISSPPGARPCDKGGICGVPGLIAIAQSTEGSIANIKAIQAGTTESGFAQADIAYWAFTATGPYKGQPKHDRLRAVAGLFPEHVHVAALAGSAIRSIRDLKGKRVSLGLKDSGARVGPALILAAQGLKEDAGYKALYLSNVQAVERLRDGDIDALVSVSGYPQPALAGLASSVGLRLVAIDKAARERVRKVASFYQDAVIPARTYDGVDADVETLAVRALWLVGVEVSADLVYQITGALWNQSSRRVLDAGHPKGKEVRLERALQGISVPLHPGAERYYREAGRL